MAPATPSRRARARARLEDDEVSASHSQRKAFVSYVGAGTSASTLFPLDTCNILQNTSLELRWIASTSLCPCLCVRSAEGVLRLQRMHTHKRATKAKPVRFAHDADLRYSDLIFARCWRRVFRSRFEETHCLLLGTRLLGTPVSPGLERSDGRRAGVGSSSQPIDTTGSRKQSSRACSKLELSPVKLTLVAVVCLHT